MAGPLTMDGSAVCVGLRPACDVQCSAVVDVDGMGWDVVRAENGAAGTVQVQTDRQTLCVAYYRIVLSGMTGEWLWCACGAVE